MMGRLLCRVGLHTNYPQQVGRWYANWRCTRCGIDLRPAPEGMTCQSSNAPKTGRADGCD